MKKHNSKISEQTTTGGAVVNAGGHVDLAAGMFDRPGPKKGSQNSKPIVPSDMVATQLATTRPPIDDEDYVPTEKTELSLAVSEISKSIPDNQFKKFYLRVKDLAQECIDSEKLDQENEGNMIESKNMLARKKLANMINEEIDDLLNGLAQVTYDDIVTGLPKEFADLEPSRRYDNAKWTDKLGREKLRRFVELVPEKELDRLHKFAANEFVDLLEEEDYISPDEGDEMRSTKHFVYDLDSYKFFFTAAFIMPVYSKFDSESKRADKGESKKIWFKLLSPLDKGGFGLPVPVAQTVHNQLVGLAAKKPANIEKKFSAMVERNVITQDQANALMKNLMSNFITLTRMTDSSQEKKDVDPTTNPRQMLKDAMTAYMATTIPQRKELLRQALEKTTPKVDLPEDMV
jgi:hypothetical protein